MMLIGLSGKAGHGKDSVADILVEHFGAIKFSMSDALYKEVAENFCVDEELLKDRLTKDKRLAALTRSSSISKEFDDLLCLRGFGWNEWLSPRVVLQLWGTEYRRNNYGENYWVNRADVALKFAMERVVLDFLNGKRNEVPIFVNTSIRFHNEVDWIRRNGGELWRVVRTNSPTLSDPDAEGHVSEKLPGLMPCDRLIINGGSLADLTTAVHLLMQGGQVVDTRPDGKEE